MIFDWDKIRSSGVVDDVPLVELWSVYTDTGDTVPVKVGFVWDGCFYCDESEYNAEAWIYAGFGISFEDTGTLVKLWIHKRNDGRWSADVFNLLRDNWDTIGIYDDMSPSEAKQIFWEYIKNKLEEIGKDVDTFIHYINEEVFMQRIHVFKTEEEAEEYGNGIKATYGMLKELEDELPDGEDAYDILMRIYS